MLRCPLCHSALLIAPKTAACANGHSFDRAREGYFNVLPAQQKNSLNPGDDAAMVQARSAFLDAGYYAPLRTALCDLIAPLAPAHLVDSGCGEGWYSTALRHTAQHTTALDISKDAVKRAAKRDKNITWLVASSADLPLANASVDVITAIFSPINAAETARVLAPGGSLIVVAPDEKHLWELRAALYAEVRPHQPEKWLAGMAPHFTLHSKSRLQFTVNLPTHSAVQALLKMTPHYWRAPRERRTQVEALNNFSTQTDFNIFRFIRNE